MTVSFNRGYCPYGNCDSYCKGKRPPKHQDKNGKCFTCSGRTRFCCKCRKACLFDKNHTCPKIKTFDEEYNLSQQGKIKGVNCSGCEELKWDYELDTCFDCKKQFCMLCLGLYFGSENLYCKKCFDKKSDEEKKKMTTEPRTYELCFICGKRHILLSAGKHVFEFQTRRYYHKNCVEELKEDIRLEISEQTEVRYTPDGLLMLRCPWCGLKEGDKDNGKRKVKESVLGWYGGRLSCLKCFRSMKKILEK